MKRQIFVGVAVMLFLAGAVCAEQPAYEPGVVIVRFADVNGQPPAKAAKLNIINNILQTSGSQVQKEYSIVRGLTVVNLPAGVLVENAVASLKQSSSVLYAEPDYIYRVSAVPNDPDFSQLWGMHNNGQSGGKADADIDAIEAWDMSTGDSNIIVAVIDTGIDYSHPDLAANMWRNTGEIADNGIDDDGNGYVDDVYGYDWVNNDVDPSDDHSHGTHVAGTIGAVGNNNRGVAGVCWNVRIMALKSFNADGVGTAVEEVNAIEYAIAKGADVINASWGGPGYSEALYDAISSAEDHGIIFVAAAGNSNVNNDIEIPDFSPSYPSSYDLDNIIAVMATTDTDMRASFSNFGLTSVDIGAPGQFIYSTVPGNSYEMKSGTSMASPHVAGACALLLSIDPTLNYGDVKKILMTTSDRTLPGYCASGGRLNLAAAARETSIDTIPPDMEGWEISPTATGLRTISMEARMSTDRSGVEYYFECIDNGQNSGWGINPLYSFTNLEPATTYTFRFKTRDRSANYNESEWSELLSTTTADGSDTLPPATGDGWMQRPKVVKQGTNFVILMQAKGVDESAPVQFRFRKVLPAPEVIGDWQASDVFSYNTGLVEGQHYTFQCEARDAIGNVSGLSEPAQVYMSTTSTGSVPVVRTVPVPYLTIQAAIDASNNRDIVQISPGVYQGPGNWDITFRGKAITVRSIDPQNPDVVASTIVDCYENPDGEGLPEQHRGFLFISSETSRSVLEGLTITNGFAFGGFVFSGRPGAPGLDDGPPAARDGQDGEDGEDGMDATGGGIQIGTIPGPVASNPSSPTIRNCVITNCTVIGGVGGFGGDGGNGGNGTPGELDPPVVPIDAGDGGDGGKGGNAGSGMGGGIYISSNSNPLIQNCRISGCIVIPGLAGDGGNGGNGANGDAEGGMWGGCGGSGGDGGAGGGAYGGGIFVDARSNAQVVGCTMLDCEIGLFPNSSGGLVGADGEIAPECPNGDGEDGTQTNELGQTHTATGGGAFYRIFQSGYNPNISACDFIHNYAETYGGGLGFSNNNTNNVTISDCNFVNNFADTNSGGAIFFEGGTAGGTLILTKCSLTDNSAGVTGGGMNVGKISYPVQSVVVVDSYFANNDADNGGGIYLNRSNIGIENTHFEENIAEEGGAINGFMSLLNINDSVIAGNRAITETTSGVMTAGLGGGLSLWNSSGVVANCVIKENVSENLGGAVYIAGGDDDPVVFENCLVTDNVAYNRGGGFSCNLLAWAQLTNCTVADNTVTGFLTGIGGGISCAEYFASVDIINSIVWGNSAYEGSQIAVGKKTMAEDADVYINYSDIEGGPWDVFIGNPLYNAVWWMEGNLYEDPVFISPSLDEEAYYLSQQTAGQVVDSPCLDAGNNPASIVGLDILTTRTDQVGDSGIVDIGYHYPIAEEVPQYSLSIYVIETGGQLIARMGGIEPFAIVAPSSRNVNAGAVVALEANPDPNFRVRAWSGTDNDASVEPDNTVTMNTNRIVTVSFEPDGMYYLDVIVIGDGTVTPSGRTLRTPNEVVTLVAVPTSTADVVIWEGTEDDNTDATQNTVVMTGHRQVTVTFYKPKILNVGASSAYPSIQAAIDAASERDIIQLMPSPQPYYTQGGFDIFQNVTITSVDPYNPAVVAATVIEQAFGDGSNIVGPAFSFFGVGTLAKLQGLTIRGFTAGGFQNPDPEEPAFDGLHGYFTFGMGINCYGASPTVENCVIDDCHSYGDHGSNGRAGSEDHPIGGNGGWPGGAWGGAVFLYGQPDFPSNPSFINCVFSNNSAIGGNGGDGGQGTGEPACGPGGAAGGWYYGDGQIDWENDFGALPKDYSGLGGAVYIGSNCAPRFENCSFLNNLSAGGLNGISGQYGCPPNPRPEPTIRYKIDTLGGAVYMQGNSSAVFSSCVFSDNIADPNRIPAVSDGFVSFGGALAVEDDAAAFLEDCVFTRNIADLGGGVFSSRSDIGIVDSNVSANRAIHGAGVLVNGGRAGISGNIFTGNDANSPGSVGAAIAIFGTGIEIIDGVIIDNNSMGHGGGIYASSRLIDGEDIGQGSIYVKNCLIAKNRALLGGAGITAVWHSDPNIVNCTITGNSAPGGRGGGIYSAYANKTNILNSIIWNNSAIIGKEITVGIMENPSIVNVAYSDVNQAVGSLAVDPGCVLNLNGGIINANPRFVSADNNNYHLSHTAAGQSVTSPCFDAGADLVSRFGLSTYTTRTDKQRDTQIVDLGYHFALPTGCLMFDFNNDGIVAMEDFAWFAQFWLGEGDPSYDNYDLREFTSCWLFGQRPFTGPDLKAPTPNPMRWQVEPNIASLTSISMIAELASDDSGGQVEYQFEETTGNPGGTDSAWQSNPMYTDIGLQAGNQYCYRVRARDEAGNATEWSNTVCVTGVGSADINAPSTPLMVMGPNTVSADVNTGSCQFQWAFEYDWWHKVVVDASTITDDSGGPIEVRFVCVSDSSLSSDNKIPALQRPIYVDTPVSLGSKAAGWQLTFDGTYIVYDVFVNQSFGLGRTLNWRVCARDEASNQACSETHTIGPPGI